MTTVSGACGDARCFRLNQLIKVMMALWTGLVTAAGGRSTQENGKMPHLVTASRSFLLRNLQFRLYRVVKKKNSYIVVACDLWRTHT
jgi:hypothetical protein